MLCRCCVCWENRLKEYLTVGLYTCGCFCCPAKLATSVSKSVSSKSELVDVLSHGNIPLLTDERGELCVLSVSPCLNQPCYRVLQMGCQESELHWWALCWHWPVSWILRTAMPIQLCPAVACVYRLGVRVHLSCLPAYQSLYKHCSLALSTGEATHHLMVPYCMSSCQ